MHGLVYPQNLLNSLPLLDTDIHALDPPTFAQLHLQHTLSHPPDNILFPFLHGLEGDNHAQNAFFATSNSAHPVQHHYSRELNTRITPKIPKYRGLVWVVCEEDIEQAGDVVSLRILRRKPVLLPSEKTASSSSSSGSGSDEDEADEDEDFDDEDEDLEMMSMSMDMDDRSSFTGDDDDAVLASPIFTSPMQVDDVAVIAPDSPAVEESPTVTSGATTATTVTLDLVDVIQRKEEDLGSHMHPIQHRTGHHPPTTLPLPIPIPSIITQPQTHVLTPSTVSSASISPVSIFDSPVGTEESLSSAAPSECPTAHTPLKTPPNTPPQTCPSDPYAPPLLTSTFRPKELLRRVRVVGPDGNTSPSNGHQRNEHGTSKWEFVPAKVPDGISLRNFGIQVPIYATLSDIIIYSPKGASPAALALARRFRAAMRSKREERMRAAASFGGEGQDKGAGCESPQPPPPPQGQRLHSPPVLSISTPTSTIVSAPFADASHDQSDPNAACAPNSVPNSVVEVNDGPSLDVSPSLNANAISKATVHTKVKSTTNANGNNNTKSEEDLLEYNVFVLDASIDDIRREVPYLMMRICGPGVPGGTGGGSSGVSASAEDSKVKIVAKAKANANIGVTKSKTEPSIPTSTSISNGVLLHTQRNALFDVGAHTDGPDGHLVEEGVVEKAERERMEKARNGMNLDAVADMDMDMDMDDGRGKEEAVLLPNTVDFALREKEEMRDLTKASEIITLYPEPPITMSPTPSPPPLTKTDSNTSTQTLSTACSSPSLPPSSKSETLETKPAWDPLVGQVYLGNSGDVPLAPDVPSHFRHAVNSARDMNLNGNPCAGLEEYFSSYDDEEALELDEEEKGSQQLPADDLFNYRATNDPTSGFGYDIAVECHELAPFPSTAHLRAADEHLGMLDLLWKERWERGWKTKEQKRIKKRKATAGAQGEEECSSRMEIRETPPTPPRPPPHASAVIHLPFPSSPPNSQTTMVSLMPVIRFLEKWMKPLPVPLALPVVPPVTTVGTATPEMKNLKLIGSGDAATNAVGTAPPAQTTTTTSSGRRWSSVAALMPSFPLGGSSSSASTPAAAPNTAPPNNINDNSTSTTSAPPPSCPLPPHPARNRSLTSPPPPSGGVYQPPQYIPKPPQQQQIRTRPLKILLYSSDGYTESSVPALCLLMAIKSLNLPEAYLELQVAKRRSFFVYQGDLGILRRVEGRLKEEKERERERERGRERERERLNGGFLAGGAGTGGVASVNANGKRTASLRGGYWSGTSSSTGSGGNGSPYPGASVAATPITPPVSGGTSRQPISSQKSSFTGRPAAKSISFAHVPHPMMVPSSHQQQQQHYDQQRQPHEHFEQHQPAPPAIIPLQPHHPVPGASYLGQTEFTGSLPNVPPRPLQMMSYQQPGAGYGSGGSGYQEGHLVVKGRPRANTSPWLPSLFGGDHQSWFNDPRFDGSFPSRVLPFLYLGNLNHASNAYMLHALGITHVVSVGECALVPPPHHMPSGGMMNQGAPCYRPGPNAHFIAGKGPGGHGSLWIEEREGRIKVLDIKGVCDDGIDTLEPQLEPICDWIDKARQEGGQVLVHCRVGVSRSATVTIAYVMKHLGLPLVDAYLIVRSRRLSVLIQPNMRLLYNLCGWEIKLAKERANGDERKIKKELARTLTWPYLAKEVHALNDKYLH